MTTEHQTQYRVSAPMIQLTGPRASSTMAALETQFRQGDILPTWANADDLGRLEREGFIEAVQA